MKKTRFTGAQIVSILKEADAGMKVADICRKHGIPDATWYCGQWDQPRLFECDWARVALIID